jgi:hypothetical protein
MDNLGRDAIRFLEVVQKVLAITALASNTFEESCLLGCNAI